MLKLREQQKRNLMASLLLSVGVPMISGGDEVSRTQHGNNNAYCHDDELSWTHWDLTPDHEEFLEFTRRLVHLRLQEPVLTRRKYFQGRSIRGADVKDIYWLDPSGREMTDEAWNAPFVRSLGVLMVGDAIDEVDERGQQVTGDTILMLLNAHFEEVPFTLPQVEAGKSWLRMVDTIAAQVAEKRFPGGTKYPLQGRTLVLFILNGERRRRRASDASSAATMAQTVGAVTDRVQDLGRFKELPAAATRLELPEHHAAEQDDHSDPAVIPPDAPEHS